jgi:hypothetical protein
VFASNPTERTLPERSERGSRFSYLFVLFHGFFHHQKKKKREITKGAKGTQPRSQTSYNTTTVICSL